MDGWMNGVGFRDVGCCWLLDQGVIVKSYYSTPWLDAVGCLMVLDVGCRWMLDQGVIALDRGWTELLPLGWMVLDV